MEIAKGFCEKMICSTTMFVNTRFQIARTIQKISFLVGIKILSGDYKVPSLLIFEQVILHVEVPNLAESY